MGLREDLEKKSNEELMRLYKEGPAVAENKESKERVVLTAGEVLSERPGVMLPQKRTRIRTPLRNTKSHRSSNSPSNRFSSYFGFQWLIATKVIKLVYWLGLLAISAGGILAIAQGEELTGQELVVPGILALTIGNVVWRLFCEGMIVAFDIHDRIAGLNGALRDILRALEDIQSTMNSNTDENTGKE